MKGTMNSSMKCLPVRVGGAWERRDEGREGRREGGKEGRRARGREGGRKGGRRGSRSAEDSVERRES
eukprot:1609222-Rhodomonas_salina.1